MVDLYAVTESELLSDSEELLDVLLAADSNRSAVLHIADCDARSVVAAHPVEQHCGHALVGIATEVVAGASVVLDEVGEEAASAGDALRTDGFAGGGAHTVGPCEQPEDQGVAEAVAFALP